MAPAPGSIVANRFELLNELGRGGMGTVWLAHHRALDARVAVKFMSAEAMRDPSFVARFELEARTAAKISSPNVVRVVDYDVHEGVPFIAMEYLEGEDLGVRLERVKRLDGAETYAIVSQVARGLARAHAAGMVHRDLKPGNVFLAREDDGEDVREVAKLLDFGVVKFTGIDALESCDGLASNTQAGTLLGTPAYMSPEQARGNTDVDQRSDLWSLAVIAFECLTGRSPFESDTLGNLFAKILFEPMPVPSAVDPGCPRAFDRWWAKAAARQPQDRFASAIEMADALGQALGILPSPVSDIRPTLVPAQPSAPPAPAQLTPLVFDVSEFEGPVVPKRRGSSKVAVALAVLIAAPVAVMATSVRTDARGTRAAAASPDISAIAPSASAPRPVPARVEVLTAAPTESAVSAPVPSSLEAQIDPRTAKARAVQPPAPPRTAVAPNVPKASAAPSAPPDDVDFGI